MGREQRLSDNVNVRLKDLKNNVNVPKRIQRASECRIVNSIIAKLGPDARKDEAFWHKVAKTLSVDQIETGLEIAAEKKPAGPDRIKYIGGIYANMMRSI